MDTDVLEWLLEGDVALQYQTYRDLLDDDRPDLQSRIAHQGWGARHLSCRNPDGSWGRRFYQPKWTCSHYTLLDLRMLGVSPDHAQIRESISQIVRDEKGPDGGINPHVTIKQSDVCVNGMFLVYACYFGTAARPIESVIDCILGEQMDDGGFNCERTRPGARHSSLHSTLCVLEGILECVQNGYCYRSDELQQAASESREFILQHRLFKSDHTGEVIHRDLLRFPFPPRWKYNVLRCLDHFRAARVPWDNRMADALEVVAAKRKPDGRWLSEAAHPGQTHFQMEKPRATSRWNTLLALRVLKTYGAAGE